MKTAISLVVASLAVAALADNHLPVPARLSTISLNSRRAGVYHTSTHYYDFDNQKARTDLEDGTITIGDYKANKLYTYKDAKCTVSDAGEWPRPVTQVPSDAVPVGKEYRYDAFESKSANAKFLFYQTSNELHRVYIHNADLDYDDVTDYQETVDSEKFTVPASWGCASNAAPADEDFTAGLASFLRGFPMTDRR
eukprot:GFYU01001793.1.p1 GENE.GFYU01001793.1~~GFYU01001793.1.p1  ORF type:complete len:202 (+),score=72.56 GFYU01001793.1:22-606(+)